MAEGVKGFSLELWTEIPNVFAVSIVSPAGEKIPLVPVRQGIGTVLNFVFERTSVYLDYRLLVERTNSELDPDAFCGSIPGNLENCGRTISSWRMGFSIYGFRLQNF